MVDSGIRIHHFCNPNRGDTRHMYDARQLDSADDSALHGQKSGKGKTSTTD